MAQVLCVGHAVQDFVFQVQEMPTQPTKHRANGFETIGGGPAATAAVAIARLGGRAQLVARVGTDAIGDIVLAELEAYGVDCSLVHRLQGRTSSLSAVLVDSLGERLIVNYLDPGMEPRPDGLPQHLPGAISAVLADTRWPEAALQLLRLARTEQLPAILDGDLPMPADSELVKIATDVAFSAGGLAEYTGKSDPEDGLREAARRTDAKLCVTLGARGTLYFEDGGVKGVDGFDVDVADTLGAGDVWHGAFALARAERLSRRDAILFANAAAAIKVQNGRGRAGAPTRAEVDVLVSQREKEV